MSVSPRIFAVFGHFQNLNLLALVQDLRDGRTAREDWLSGSHLCPVAHGMSRGSQVYDLHALALEATLGVGCDFAARQMGADQRDVLSFVQSWDEGILSDGALLRQLEEVWAERLADAVATQQVMWGGRRPTCRERSLDSFDVARHAING